MLQPRLALPQVVLLLMPGGLALLSACGNADPAALTDCDPACPANQTCVAGVCVGSDDMARTVAPDAAVSQCSSPCQAPTPYCHSSRTCVECLEDAHCPTGKVCKSRPGGASCV